MPTACGRLLRLFFSSSVVPKSSKVECPLPIQQSRRMFPHWFTSCPTRVWAQLCVQNARSVFHPVMSDFSVVGFALGLTGALVRLLSCFGEVGIVLLCRSFLVVKIHSPPFLVLASGCRALHALDRSLARPRKRRVVRRRSRPSRVERSPREFLSRHARGWRRDARRQRRHASAPARAETRWGCVGSC